MFVTVLYRLAGSPQVSGGTPFTDLTQDWYKDAVAWAVSKGITTGTSASAFSPNSPTTREQAAVFLFRYALSHGELGTFSKGSYGGEIGALTTWAEAEGRWALEAGLYSGVRGAMSEPRSAAPRSLLAEMLYNYSHPVQ